MKVTQNIPPPQPKPFYPIVITIESRDELVRIVRDLGAGNQAYDLYKQLNDLLLKN